MPRTTKTVKAAATSAKATARTAKPARKPRAPRKAAAAASAVTHEQIALRAYEMHLAGTGGDAVEHWLRAERELAAA